jgi:Ulp1 family protease
MRSSPDSFWDAVKKKYKKADLDSAKLLLVPIFTGVTTGGHFLLVIIDRTAYQPGIFFYFGSHESWDKAAFVEVLDALVKTGLWNTDSRWRNNIARGTSGMPQQGRGTNDCGAFTCCLASAFIQNALDRHAFDESRWGSLGPDTFGQNIRFSRQLSVEAWGQYARVHIWNSIKNQTVNFLDTAILKLRYELIDTTPVV